MNKYKLLFLLLSGCSSHIIYESIPKVECSKGDECPIKDVTILIDDRFTTRERELIGKAYSSWPNYYFNLKQVIVPKEELKGSNDVGFFSVIKQNPISSDGGDNVGILGWTNWSDSGAFIQIRESLDEETFFPVVLHEFGHAFHMQHYTGPYPSIMHPKVDYGEAVECIDVINYCNIWGCQPEPCDPAQENDIDNPIRIKTL